MYLARQTLPSYTRQKKANIHHVTTMLATSENVLFPGHNHLLTTGTDDPSLARARANNQKCSVISGWWLGGYLVDSGFFAQWYCNLQGI